MGLEEILRSGFAELSLPLDETAVRRYRQYYELLTERNKVMNLTAIEGEEASARLHFLDCAALLTLADFRGKSVIDVGSGAGCPGLALKIAEPGVELTLLDSLDKRVHFLRETCDTLGFEDVRCLHARAEEAPADLRQAYDVAVSRAVARLNLLCELCLPFVKVGGLFAAMKGPGADEELIDAKRAIRTLGGRLEAVARYTIPGTEVTHTAILIRTTSDTPARYPRRWAQMKKQPL